MRANAELEYARIRLVSPLTGRLGGTEKTRWHRQAGHARLGVEAHGLEAEEIVAELLGEAAAVQVAGQQAADSARCIGSYLTSTSLLALKNASSAIGAELACSSQVSADASRRHRADHSPAGAPDMPRGCAAACP